MSDITLPRMVVKRTKEEIEEGNAKWEQWRKDKAKQIKRDKKKRADMDKQIKDELAEAHRITAQRVKKLKEKAKARKVQKLRPLVKKTKKSSGQMVSRVKASPLGEAVLTASQHKRLGASKSKKWQPAKAFKLADYS